MWYRHWIIEKPARFQGWGPRNLVRSFRRRWTGTSALERQNLPGLATPVRDRAPGMKTPALLAIIIAALRCFGQPAMAKSSEY